MFPDPDDMFERMTDLLIEEMERVGSSRTEEAP
jgi:hypothetical protein